MNMEKILKEFKSLCWFTGGMAMLQILNAVNAYKFAQNLDINTLVTMDYASMGISESTVMEIMKISAIVPGILGVLVLAFLCFKGLKEVNDPSPAKIHLILAVISAVAYAFCTGDALVNLFKPGADLLEKGLETLVCAASTALMVYYFHLGKKIRTKE